MRDADGQQLAYVYYESEPGRRLAAKLLSKDEDRRIAVNFAKLPDLGMAQGLRNMVRFSRQRVLPNLYQAAKRGCMIAGSDRGRTAPALSVPTTPTIARQANRWGAKAKPPAFSRFRRLCCVTHVLRGSALWGV